MIDDVSLKVQFVSSPISRGSAQFSLNSKPSEARKFDPYKGMGNIFVAVLTLL